ncbi:hypothetical protein SAMN05421642_11778 [Rhodococcoides kyotonense]|uniref:Glycosyltransferase RgtA/B/C/D-like domain-containing protein n=2 Tax=Rhodococcoides kyotonense TaxID=398843 RepID=A0A239MD73_9NOCA|nr:hypothetical protein SAMN05421642_11778 [Rhodococcus kyotonensis]
MMGYPGQSRRSSTYLPGGNLKHSAEGGTGTSTLNWRYLGACFFLVSVSLTVAAMLMHNGVRYHDERVYLELAESVTRGTYQLGGNETAYRPPAWPIMLAIPVATGTNWIVFGLPLALLIAAAIAAGVIAARIAGTLAGIIGCVAVGFYPLSLYTATTLYPQTLALTSLLMMWLVVVSWETDVSHFHRKIYALAVGIFGAVMSLAVPTLAPTASAVVLLAMVTARRSTLRLGRTFIAVGFVVPFAAWVLRNMVELGHFIPLSTSSGINLLYGNHPNATASSGVDVDINEQRDYVRASGLNEYDRDKFFRQEAIRWIKENPAESVRLYFGKLLNYFSPLSEPATGGTHLPATIGVAVTLVCGILLLLSLFRLLWRGRVPLLRSELWMLAIFFVNAPFMAVFFTRARFRQPLDSILLVESAIALGVILCWLVQTRRKAA